MTIKEKQLAKNAKKIIRNAKRIAPTYKSIHGAWIEENGRQYVTDTHRILEINNPIELPALDENTTQCKCMNIIKQAKRYDTYRFIIPSLDEMKEQIRILKKNKKRNQRILLSLGDGCYTVNAEYLFEMSEALGGVDAVYINKKSRKTHPLYLESDIGTAYILPCTATDSKEGYFLCD